MSTVYHRPADPSGDDSYVRPLFADRCQAGFPSPATDYAEQELDLNSYCISRNAATFFLRASGESMNQAGVQNGDLLVVDRAENHCISPEVFGHQLREQVKSWTGLTMGVGIAPTKTLAKSAQWATKQWPQFSGVVALEAENRNRILKLLGLQPVGEVWGVGRRLTEKLNALGINTALQLAQANTAFIRNNFSVIIERTVRELNGESCISLEEAPPAKQQIVCSRSFGERITDKDAMHQAVVQYAERAAEKLRGERQYCRQVTTFVRTSPFAVKEPCYSNAAVEKLPLPTQDSRDIIAAACRALNHVWREGYRYMKAGVMLADFTPSGIAQPGLFDEIQPRKNSEKLMKTLDELNQSGKGKVWFAGRGTMD